MTSLSKHQSNSFTKLLLIGDPKSGKTGSLVSLVKAGYKLRILDFDNLLDFLKGQILEQCPDQIDNVEFRSVRDKYKAGVGGTVIDGKPKAWIDSIKLLNRWKYTDADDTEVDLGDPAEWGPDCVLVIDSLSRWCDACFAFHETVMPRGKSGEYDGRAVYGNAQKDMEKQLAMLTSETIKTNLIVICHGQYMERDDGKTKIFPRGIGQALSPNIPSYFPNYVRYTNDGGKRTIQLESDKMIDLATTRPSVLTGTLPVDTGLATIFKTIRDGVSKPEPAPKPKSVTLRRA